ncbi:MAG TPA: cobalamin B12-binding domain-containing protein [Conexivisphaerales archaeon]|nr:cobalamin B12-binding domain-containing protein [Conexivisphaerales archaeon]
MKAKAKKGEARKVKVLVTKVGLDGHDRGLKVVAKGLADAGFEVVYLGVHQTVANVVATAIQEDVDVIAVSILSGSHLELGADLLKALKEKGLSFPVIFGGVIPAEDARKLKEMGVSAVYGPGTPLATVADAARNAAGAKS